MLEDLVRLPVAQKVVGIAVPQNQQIDPNIPMKINEEDLPVSQFLTPALAPKRSSILHP